MKEALTFDDVLMVPMYNRFTSRNDERIDTSVTLGDYKFQIPIISSNMDTITGSEMAKKMGHLGGLGILHRFCSIEDNVKEFIQVSGNKSSPGGACGSESIEYTTCGVSIGVNEGLTRAEALYDTGARIFCIDVAHGHSESVIQMIKQMKQKYKDILLIAGNVCTYAGADILVGAGADVIKVGIGPGSVCTTRIKTGVGVPQFTAIQDCKRINRPIIADGGLRTPGDIAKAIAAGATMVMLGNMLAGTDETPGDVHPKGDWKTFRGMASKEANEDFYGAMTDWKTAEGISTSVQCKGPVENVIKDIMGGIRSSLTYNGAHNFTELRRSVEFVRITQAGRIESGAHIKQ